MNCAEPPEKLSNYNYRYNRYFSIFSVFFCATWGAICYFNGLPRPPTAPPGGEMHGDGPGRPPEFGSRSRFRRRQPCRPPWHKNLMDLRNFPLLWGGVVRRTMCM